MNLAVDLRGQSDQEERYAFTDSDTGETASGDRANEYDEQSWVLSLHNHPDDDLYVKASVYGNDFSGKGFPGLGNLFGPVRNVLTDQDTSNAESDYFMTRLLVNQRLPNELRAELQGYFWEMNRDSAFRQPEDIAVLKQGQQKHGVEARLKQEEPKWRTQWVAAAGFSRDEVVEADSILKGFDGVVQQAVPSPYDDLDREVVSGLLQARTELWENSVALLYGGRIDDYSDFGTQETPRLGLIYHVLHHTTLKFLYGNAFRAPVALEVTNSPNIKGNPDIEPEVIDSYEVVLHHKREKWDGEIVLFYNRWKDGIVVGPSSDPEFAGEYLNIGENESRGIECSGTYLNAPWFWLFSTSYVQSENTVDHVDYAAFPEWIINLGVGYVIEPWDMEIFLGNRVHLEAKAGPTTSFVPRPEDLPDFWRCDLNITKELDENIRLFASVRNLFDRDNALPSITNAEKGFPGEPLNVSLGARYQF